jgi:hypothetical protein
MLELIPLGMTLVTLAGYGSAVRRLRRRGVRWPVIEVTLAAIVMAQWYVVSGRDLARTRRRSQSVGP